MLRMSTGQYNVKIGMFHNEVGKKITEFLSCHQKVNVDLVFTFQIFIVTNRIVFLNIVIRISFLQ